MSQGWTGVSMNKELFVSSTPHETKVGLVEDDLLAEVYLERENEYTLAGSIYKGRVTRVLPGMQSAFVDIGLERDAFLYVSDFMELEEHDDDLTDSVPATRAVPDLRQQPQRAETAPADGEAIDTASAEPLLQDDTEEGTFEADNLADAQPAASTADPAEAQTGADSQNRDRGSFRGRRRRRGGRRDGRDRGPERSADRSPDRSSERGPDRSPDRGDRSPERFSRPVADSAPPRSHESSRSQPSGPPAGYTPILLPGESISKYSRYAQPPAAVQELHEPETPRAFREEHSEAPSESVAPLAATFPEDEPIFAATESAAEPLHEEHEDSHPIHEEHLDSASTSADWNQELRRPEAASVPSLGWPGESTVTVEPETIEPEQEVEQEEAGCRG